MKICFFAHIPPPYHGQSIAVKTLIDGLQADFVQGGSNSDKIQVFHVDARFSDDVDEIGGFQLKKLFRIFKYVLKALWIRFRYGVKNFYYVPAPGLKAAVYRDWIVMAACRPFYSKVIYHFQAVGLGEWVQNQSNPIERWVSNSLFQKIDLCLALSDFYNTDISLLRPKRIVTTPNGVPDPCPDFEQTLLPKREQKWDSINQLAKASDRARDTQRIGEINILYLSLCYSEKGLFDAMEAVRIYNEKIQEAETNHGFKARLTVAGKFYQDSEKKRFDSLVASEGYQFSSNGKKAETDRMVKYVGFAYDEKKDRLFRENDLFIFPTYYAMEGHPLCLLEALGYGLPTITTYWRAVPDIYQEDTILLVKPRDVEGLACAIEKAIQQPKEIFRNNRTRFLNHYSKEIYIQNVKRAMLSLELEH